MINKCTGTPHTKIVEHAFVALYMYSGYRPCTNAVLIITDGYQLPWSYSIWDLRGKKIQDENIPLYFENADFILKKTPFLKIRGSVVGS